MQRPIGVFDSGIGGLTVVSEIARALPKESLVFLGDTARVPYGSRGPEVIKRFALEMTAFLAAQDVKYLVAACNTISSTCLDLITERVTVPVLGVIGPAAQAAARATRSGRVGVIGTRATIGTDIYARQIHEMDPRLEVFSHACPLFVSLAEEGLLTDEATRLIARDYLRGLREQQIDVLILGCTHYPLLRDVIQEAVGEDVLLVDSSQPTAQALASELRSQGLLRIEGSAEYRLYVTDAPQRVEQVASTFFGRPLPSHLRKISLDEAV